MSIKHALNVRSDFSLGESLLQINHLVEDAKEAGYESVALTDTMTLSSMVDFSNQAKKAGLRPIIGVTLRVVNDPTYRVPSKGSGIKEIPNPMFTLKAYVEDERGIKSLMKLLSKANSDEYFYYYSRTGLHDVLQLEGVTITSSDFNNLFHRQDHLAILEKLSSRFGKDKVYCELVPIETPLFDTLNQKAIVASETLGLPLLATYPALYRNDEDAPTLEVLAAISGQLKMAERRRSIQYTQTFGMHDPKALAFSVASTSGRMGKAYGRSFGAAWMQACKNIKPFAESLKYSFEKLPPCLPVMAENEFAALVSETKKGWAKRFSSPVMGHVPADFEVYKQRLAYELGVLRDMGFSNYFLLVQDLVMWAKNNDILVGPGRGSVGGSLVAYLLEITDVDPIRFNLFFERFINPERQDLPDADLDFMSTKRHLVIEYLREKYGADKVAGVSNYTTLASASALRETGRVFESNMVDLACTKLVPKEHGRSFTLTEASEVVPEIEKFMKQNPDLWTHAIKLEGVMRSLGQHAAGIVVSAEPIVERAVVETRTGGSVVNWDKRVVEDWGLIKMDILGLSTLDMLEIARTQIKKRHGKNVNYLKLPLDEPDVMDAFGKGETTAVFQFESPGMKKLLRDLALGGRLNFDDITAATALYRPGPMDSGLLDDYVAIKQGVSDVYYEHESVRGALAETHGIIVYQEQVMAVARDLAGFSLAGADHLRKAIGKKDIVKMKEMKDAFVAGACIGSIEIELDDGRKLKVHRGRKFKVAECNEMLTAEEIFSRNLTPLNISMV